MNMHKLDYYVAIRNKSWQTVGEDSVIAERLTADGAEMWEEWRRGGIRFRKR